MGVSAMLSQSGKACSPHTKAAGLVRKSDLVGPGQVQVQRWNSIEFYFLTWEGRNFLNACLSKKGKENYSQGNREIAQWLTYCSSGGLGFGSQHPPGRSQLPIVCNSCLRDCQVLTVAHRNSCRHTHIHINKNE